LSAGELAVGEARLKNDMPLFRLILKQYEERAMQIIQEEREQRDARRKTTG
jgi:hypothetical protein